MHYLNLKRSLGKTIIFSFAIALFFSFSALAQGPVQAPPQQQQQVETDFSQQDLEKFVSVYIKSTEIQQGNEGEMIQAIEEEDIAVDRFSEILNQRQQQQGEGEVDATAEELAAFEKAAEKVMAVQQEAQQEIEQMIEDEMGAAKYQQIAMAYQQSPELQQKVQQILETKMGDQQ